MGYTASMDLVENPGVGPHPKPWPTDQHYDQELLRSGDRRNVEDKYRYWKVEAIKADLDKTRVELEIAIENYQHDFNIGTIVRSANAFNVSKVHIIGKRQWNRRGAMVTDRYMNIVHHQNTLDFTKAMSGKHIVAVDNIEGADCLSDVELPKKCVLVFGGEGPGISQSMLEASEQVIKIEQLGSTRSINVGVAAGIVMYEWTKQHFLMKKISR